MQIFYKKFVWEIVYKLVVFNAFKNKKCLSIYNVYLFYKQQILIFFKKTNTIQRFGARVAADNANQHVSKTYTYVHMQQIYYILHKNH